MLGFAARGARAGRARRSPACRSTGSAALPLLVPFGLGLGHAVRARLARRAQRGPAGQARPRVVAAVDGAPAGRGARRGSRRAPRSSGGVTAPHVHAALLIGAAACLLIGIPAAASCLRAAVAPSPATPSRSSAFGVSAPGLQSGLQTEQPRSFVRDGQTTGGEPSRKVRTPQGRVVGNADPGKPAGKCHRNDTA